VENVSRDCRVCAEMDRASRGRPLTGTWSTLGLLIQKYVLVMMSLSSNRKTGSMMDGSSEINDRWDQRSVMDQIIIKDQ
jgi:hypothetical protein